MLKGFKEFIMRGNVVELAIAVVIGTAFTAVVTAVVTSIIKPLISAAGGANTNGLGVSLKHTAGVPHGSAQDALGASTFINLSAVINALITFLVVAAVVYFFVVVPLNKIAERRARGLEPEPEIKPEDITLLEQIRDLLAAQQPPAAGTSAPATP